LVQLAGTSVRPALHGALEQPLDLGPGFRSDETRRSRDLARIPNASKQGGGCLTHSGSKERIRATLIGQKRRDFAPNRVNAAGAREKGRSLFRRQVQNGRKKVHYLRGPFRLHVWPHSAFHNILSKFSGRQLSG